MAETAPLPFAVDTDIAPLQGQYFESVAQNVSDPRLRSQLYDKVRATFGGIQQARDIQRAKAQEDEDRTLSLEVRRAQLDQNRMELGAARDKVRKQQEAAAKGMAFNSAMSELEPQLRQAQSPEKARAALYAVAAQFSDVVSELPAAQTRLTLLDKSLAEARKSDYRDIKTVAQLNDDAEAEKLYPGITQKPEYQAEKALAGRKLKIAEDRKQTQLESLISEGARVAATGLSKMLEADTFPSFTAIDTQLQYLDAAGFITPDQKTALRNKGIYVLEPKDSVSEETKTKDYGPQSETKVSQSDQTSLLRSIALASLSKAAARDVDITRRAPVEVPPEPDPRDLVAD
jgi:hypothetical protein